ncbi:HAD-IA family hydrolase [Treponema sp.]|uniref:HAD-IA family hydrolase n=1 Tax=Treponema sp. TaxID=166 RepID=UPI003F0C13A7
MVLIYRAKRFLKRYFIPCLDRIHRTNLSSLNQKIFKLISNNTYDFVSFDIFDTLLVRPCIQPCDIFSLIAARVDVKFNIDFYNMRINAESELNNKYATIDDIYNHISKIYNLDSLIINELKQEELNVESELLTVRKDFYPIYECAKKSGKKIIAMSDMYLSAEFLRKLLKEKGFEFDDVFISCNEHARKDEGELYKNVIQKYGTKKIIHIGDNYNSDFKIAKKNGIKAVYYPSVMKILGWDKNLRILVYRLSKNWNVENYLRNIFIGFTLNRLWFENYKNYKVNIKNPKFIADFFVGPYLVFISRLIQTNKNIQENYKKIYFVARDGYLPQKIYDVLNKNNKYLPTEYIYGSRRAYWPGVYSDFNSLFAYTSQHVSRTYTFENFINAYIVEPDQNKKIKLLFSNKELGYYIAYQKNECIALLKKEKKAFDEIYDALIKQVKDYYSRKFENQTSEDNRVVVFDIGYGGTVSLGLSKLLGISVDKIYISQTSQNLNRDYYNGTKTYILMNGIFSTKNRWADLLWEEVFSPLEGSCLGFAKNGDEIKPILETFNPSELMIEVKENIEKFTIEFAKDFEKYFSSFIDDLYIADVNPLFEVMKKLILKNKYIKQNFSKIQYDDKAARAKQISLGEKVKIKIKKDIDNVFRI